MILNALQKSGPSTAQIQHNFTRLFKIKNYRLSQLTPFDTSARMAVMKEIASIEEIKPGVVYTAGETEKLLRVSNSTMKRLLKKGLIRANKIGGQYRILGREILHALSPDLERSAARSYYKVKRKVVGKINKW